MNELHDLAYFARCVGTADYVVKSKSSKPNKSDWQIGLGDDPIERDGWPAWIGQTRNTLRMFCAAMGAAKDALGNATEIRPNEQAADQWKPRCYRLMMRLANAVPDTGSIDGDVAAFVDGGRLPSEWPTWLAELVELADEYEAVELAGVNAPEPAATEPATTNATTAATSGTDKAAVDTQFDAETRALAVMAHCPEITSIAEVARQAGCTREHLSKNCPRFKTVWDVAAKMRKQPRRIVRGVKDKNGNLEAWQYDDENEREVEK